MRSPARFLIPVILVVTSFLYAPSFKGTFVYDDHWYVEHNPAIRTITPWRFFVDPDTFAAPQSGMAHDAYRPLTTLSQAINYQWAGLNPALYRAVNFVLFLVCGWLFSCIAHTLLKSEASAALACAIFLWHPVQVQSVAWISQRSTVLGGIFALGSFYLLYQSGTNRVRQTGGLLLFALAVFAKETMIVLPVLLWLIHRWEKKPARKWLPGELYTLTGLGLVGAGFLTVRFLVLRTWSMTPDLPPDRLADLALGVMAFPVYLGKLIVPIALRASYAYPRYDPVHILWAGLLFLGYLVALALAWRLHRPSGAALAWILVGLLPALQILPLRAYVLERALFVPIMGLALWAGWLYRESVKARPFLSGAALLFAFLTWRQAPVWTSDAQLWGETVRVEPENAFAHACYAETLGDTPMAVEEYEKVLLHHPAEGIRYAAYQNLASVHHQWRQNWKANYWKAKAESAKSGG